MQDIENQHGRPGDAQRQQQFAEKVEQIDAGYSEPLLVAALRDKKITAGYLALMPQDDARVVVTDAILGCDGVAAVVYKNEEVGNNPAVAQDLAEFVLALLEGPAGESNESYYVLGTGLLVRDVRSYDLALCLRPALGLSVRDLLERASLGDMRAVWEKISNTIEGVINKCRKQGSKLSGTLPWGFHIWDMFELFDSKTGM